MFLPSSFPKDIYWLWDKQEQESPPIHKRKSALNSESSATTNGTIVGPSRQEQGSDSNSDTRRQASNLYAPPLVGYSAEAPGAQLSYSDYNIRRLVVGEDNVGFRLSHTPLAMSRLERLRRIKNYGYRTIRPVGVEKTMEELLIAGSRSRVESGMGEMDASMGEDNLGASINATDTVTGEGGIDNNSSGLGLGISENIDLDAGILDADASRELRDDEFDEDNENENENRVENENMPQGGNAVVPGNNTDPEVHSQTLNTTSDSYNVDFENYRVGQDTTGEDINYENILLHNSNVNEDVLSNDVNGSNHGNEDDEDAFGDGASAIPGFMAEEVAYQEGGGDTRDILMSTTRSARTNELLHHIITMGNSASLRTLPSNPTTWDSPFLDYSRQSIDANQSQDGVDDDPNMEIDE